MAIAFDAAANGGTAAATSLTWSHTVGSNANRILWTVVTPDSATDPITGVTYNGVAMTLVQKLVSVATFRDLYLFGLVAPASGAHSVVVSANASCNIRGGSVSYDGVAQTTTPDNINTGTGTTEPFTRNITPVADNCWVCCAVSGYFGGTNWYQGSGSDYFLRFLGDLGIPGFYDLNAPIHPATSSPISAQHNPASASNSQMIVFTMAPPGGASPAYVDRGLPRGLMRGLSR